MSVSRTWLKRNSRGTSSCSSMCPLFHRLPRNFALSGAQPPREPQIPIVSDHRLLGPRELRVAECPVRDAELGQPRTALQQQRHAGSGERYAARHATLVVDWDVQDAEVGQAVHAENAAEEALLVWTTWKKEEKHMWLRSRSEGATLAPTARRKWPWDDDGGAHLSISCRTESPKTAPQMPSSDRISRLRQNKVTLFI